jgi:hypothetical protein
LLFVQAFETQSYTAELLRYLPVLRKIYHLRRRVDLRIKKEPFLSNMLTKWRDPSFKTKQCVCMQVHKACLEADLRPCFHVREPKHWQELAKWRMPDTTCSHHSRANQRENVIGMQVPRASILLVGFAFLTMMISIEPSEVHPSLAMSSGTRSRKPDSRGQKAETEKRVVNKPSRV